MSDVECPYCKVEVEICHDDGYGCEEDNTYTQECSSCGNIFAYTTSITISHEASKCPCQNGEPHSLKDIIRFPKEFAVGMKRCEWCDEEFVVDKDARDKARAAYMGKLEASRRNYVRAI